MTNWTTLRKQAANRRRRVIFNNDGDDIMKAPEATVESFLSQRCYGLEGTHVDSCFYATFSNFDRSRHNSRVGEIDLTDSYHQIYPEWFGANHLGTFIEQGFDGLSLAADFCHKNGIEFFWSARMNDMHDNWHPPMWTTFKKENPELRLWREGDYGRPGNGSIEPHMYYSAMDYGREEVRRRMFDAIIDVCERYDVDGIELDFMREPAYFRPTMEGRAVEAEHLEIMTAYVRSLREAIDAVAQKRGKPILLGARVPNLLIFCRFIGLDLETWLQQDLLDLVVASLEFVPFTGSIDEVVELAHRHGVQIYAGIGGNAGELNGWAAAATNALAQGTDGIATFNAFDPHFPAWSVIGDREKLAEAEKRYALENIGSAMSTHHHVIDRTLVLPVAFTEGAATIYLPVREDLAAKAGQITIVLSVAIDGCAAGDDVKMRLNGTPLDPAITITTAGCAPRAVGSITFVAQVEPTVLVNGDNQIQIAIVPIEPRAGAAAVSDVQLFVRNRAR